MNHQEVLRTKLEYLLLQIRDNETNYGPRTMLVYEALAVAVKLGYPCGIRKLKKEEDTGWPVVVIELPTGEVSWHCEATSLEFDGYDTEEKYRRIQDYANSK
jgi:hypothetical protein